MADFNVEVTLYFPATDIELQLFARALRELPKVTAVDIPPRRPGIDSPLVNIEFAAPQNTKERKIMTNQVANLVKTRLICGDRSRQAAIYAIYGGQDVTYVRAD
jgi:hypothetical protein